MEKEIKTWYDKEGDYLEVIFDRKAGYFKEAGDDSGLTGKFAGYSELFANLKERIRSAQVRAALSVNRELVLLYG